MIKESDKVLIDKIIFTEIPTRFKSNSLCGPAISPGGAVFPLSLFSDVSGCVAICKQPLHFFEEENALLFDVGDNQWAFQAKKSFAEIWFGDKLIWKNPSAA